MLQMPPYASESDDSCFWSPFFFSTAFFQLQNPFYVKARSALDEVSIPLWSAFKQVWQQAASLLSSWCNHLNRSNHAVSNDLFVRSLLPKVFEILQLLWTIWYVYKALMWRAGLCLYRFQFTGYCCLWLHIIYISGSFCDSDCFMTTPGSVSLVHGFTHNKSVPYLFSTPQARSQQQILIHLLKKLALVNYVSGVLYLVARMWIFSPRIW